MQILAHLCISSPTFSGQSSAKNWCNFGTEKGGNAAQILPGKSLDQKRVQFCLLTRRKCCPFFSHNIYRRKVDAISFLPFYTKQGEMLPIFFDAQFTYQEGGNAVQILPRKSSEMLPNFFREHLFEKIGCNFFSPLYTKQAEMLAIFFEAHFCYQEGGNAAQILPANSSDNKHIKQKQKKKGYGEGEMLPNFFRGHFPEKMDAISSHLCITSRAVCFPLFPGASLLPSRWNAVHIFPGKSSDTN